MISNMPAVHERDGNNTPTVSYTRLPRQSEATAGGNDLSGSMEGAGGIGGLLARSSGYSGGNWTTYNYYFADGNGNITYMLDNSQAMVASYRYDPFGNTISSSGTPKLFSNRRIRLVTPGKFRRRRSARQARKRYRFGWSRYLPEGCWGSELVPSEKSWIADSGPGSRSDPFLTQSVLR